MERVSAKRNRRGQCCSGTLLKIWKMKIRKLLFWKLIFFVRPCNWKNISWRSHLERVLARYVSKFGAFCVRAREPDNNTNHFFQNLSWVSNVTNTNTSRHKNIIPTTKLVRDNCGVRDVLDFSSQIKQQMTKSNFYFFRDNILFRTKFG